MTYLVDFLGLDTNAANELPKEKIEEGALSRFFALKRALDSLRPVYSHENLLRCLGAINVIFCMGNERAKEHLERLREEDGIKEDPAALTAINWCEELLRKPACEVWTRNRSLLQGIIMAAMQTNELYIRKYVEFLSSAFDVHLKEEPYRKMVGEFAIDSNSTRVFTIAIFAHLRKEWVAKLQQMD